MSNGNNSLEIKFRAAIEWCMGELAKLNRRAERLEEPNALIDEVNRLRAELEDKSS